MVSRGSGDLFSVLSLWAEQLRVSRDMNPERRIREITIVIIQFDVGPERFEVVYGD